MKALVKKRPEPGLNLLDIAPPIISRPDDVLFRVAYCAICVGDLMITPYHVNTSYDAI